MSNNENKNPQSSPEGITSLSDEEAITEIDIGSFLDIKDEEAPIGEEYHKDIENTQQTLEDEIDSLMDAIMNTEPVTAIPKPLQDFSTKNASSGNILDELWMTPDEYLDIPEEKNEPAVPEKPVEVDEGAKDDIFEMIESLKIDTDTETGYDDILSTIEENDNIVTNSADELTKGYVAPPEEEPTEQPEPEDEGIDINAEDFEAQLAELLGDAPTKKEKKGETITEPAPIPISAPVPTQQVESGPIPISAPVIKTTPVYDIIPTAEKTVGNEPIEIIEDDGKISRKERKQMKLDAQRAEGRSPSNVGNIIRKIVLVISVITIIISGSILINTYIIEPYKFKKEQQEMADIIVEPVSEPPTTPDTPPDPNYPAGILSKYKKLYDINSDVAGWISIPALEINLPIVKSQDNRYYLKRNIYKKRTEYGVPFFDYRMEDLKNLPRNTVIYGHNMRYDDLIFGMLENYRQIDGFKKSPVIECNTIYGDYQWFVYATFITNSKSSDDNGYVLTYNFLDISEKKFLEYIAELDKRKFYTTGVDILPTDKILTLSTCCYDFEGGRLVVVARMRRANESTSVDTSKAVKNDNPKYPQAWYNANKKQNPYASDARWSPYDQ